MIATKTPTAQKTQNTMRDVKLPLLTFERQIKRVSEGREKRYVVISQPRAFQSAGNCAKSVKVVTFG